MPHFEVTLKRTLTEYYCETVEADSPQEASRKIRESVRVQLEHGEDPFCDGSIGKVMMHQINRVLEKAE